MRWPPSTLFSTFPGGYAAGKRGKEEMGNRSCFSYERKNPPGKPGKPVALKSGSHLLFETEYIHAVATRQSVVNHD
jgi:ectoine hydroxylase-related dioxygenase (phytanoyl-CoA dioxygenase family)